MVTVIAVPPRIDSEVVRDCLMEISTDTVNLQIVHVAEIVVI